MSAVGWLRAANIAVWALSFTLSIMPTWRVLAARSRTYDVLWALSGAVALMIIGFNLRALVAPDSVSALIGLHVFSIMIAGTKIWASRSYQRVDRG